MFRQIEIVGDHDAALLLLKQGTVHVRPVNLRVTQRAGLILRGLVMEGGGARRIGEGRRMARQAQQIHVADLEHVSIGRAVRRVAGFAAFDLHRLMLEYKRPALIRMAGVANRVLRRRSAHLLGCDGAVRVMAIAALDQTLVHAVVKGHLELRLLLQVAP